MDVMWERGKSKNWFWINHDCITAKVTLGGDVHKECNAPKTEEEEEEEDDVVLRLFMTVCKTLRGLLMN